MFPSLYGSIPTRTNAAFFLLVQNDCATNKKQSSSHHAHSMSFSVDFSTSSDLENHNYLAQNQFPTFFNTPCLAIFVVLLSSPFWIVLEHTSIREVPILFCFPQLGIWPVASAPIAGVKVLRFLKLHHLSPSPSLLMAMSMVLRCQFLAKNCFKMSLPLASWISSP